MKSMILRMKLRIWIERLWFSGPRVEGVINTLGNRGKGMKAKTTKKIRRGIGLENIILT